MTSYKGELDRRTAYPTEDLPDQPDQLLANLQDDIQTRIARMRESGRKVYRVFGIDRFDGASWPHGEYKTADEALEEARRLTREVMQFAPDESIATVYYAYDPTGRYIGGDAWKDE